jgi:hypothetical protein
MGRDDLWWIDGLMAASFAFMWVVSMYQMWFYTPPKFVLDTDGQGPASP